MRSLFALLLFAASSASAQNVCDNLLVSDVRYHAFTDTLINVYCANWNQTEIFNYPGFMLRNAEGDSVAGETVNTFGIGNGHVAYMRIVDGVTFADHHIDGTLELWTDFYAEQACTFALDESLCPTDDCNPLSLSLVNWGGALTNGVFNFVVRNADNENLLEGQLTLDDTHQDTTVALCLPNGHYTITVESTEGTSMGQPWAVLTEDGPFNSPAVQIPLPHGETSIMDVPLYIPCLTTPNSIAQPNEANAVFTLLPDGIVVDAPGSGQLTIVDLAGRMLHQLPVNGNARVLGLTSGIYVATYQDSEGQRKSIKMRVLR